MTAEPGKRNKNRDGIYRRSYIGSLYLLFILFLLFICRSSLSSKPAGEIDSLAISNKDSSFIGDQSVSKDVKTSINQHQKPDKRSQKNKIKELTVSKKLVNINTASAEELAELKGIGKKIAGEIIKFRNENGDFSSEEDIMKVKGIGKAKYSSIKENIILK